METSFILLLILVILLIGVPIVMRYFLKQLRRKEAIKDSKSLVSMRVSIPRLMHKSPLEQNEPMKDFKEMISPMEQFFASMTVNIHQRSFLDWLFSTPSHISFEIVSVGNAISFFVVFPKQLKSTIERQLHSFFPFAEIEYCAPPKMFNDENPAIKMAEFELVKPYVLPIKTYRYLESDPLAGLTTVMTKLNKGSIGAVQVLIRPRDDLWRNKVAAASGHVAKQKVHLIYQTKTEKFLRGVLTAINPPKDDPLKDQAKPLTPQQEELMKLLQEKGSKSGFEVVLRAITTGKDELEADSHIKTIITAFSQYYSANGNSLRYSLKSGDSAAKKYLYREFSGKKLLLNTEEISSIYHFPLRTLETPGVTWLNSRKLPAPANLPKSGVVIGEAIYRGDKQYVRQTDKDRLRHLFMIGKTGTGKTTLFETMIEQDMANGKGLCFVDPLGDAVESLLKKVPTERAKDVIIFDPSDTQFPFGLNLLEYKNPEERDFLIQEVIEIFYKLFDPQRTGIVGPQWEHWARNAALTVMSNPGGGSLIDLPRLFTDDAFRDSSVKNVTDPVVRAFWEQQLAKTADFHKSEMYNYFISKFGRFMTNDLMRNIIGQKESSFNFRELMDSGKILFINLAKGKIGEINSNLLGLILVSKMQVAAFSRADIPEEERAPFYLYVDEFQNFTTDTFATILSEARKYGLSLNVANQYFAQLTERIRDAVIGNVGTIITYRIGASDAEFLTNEMPGLTVDDMTNLDRFEAFVKLLVDLTPSKVFSMRGVKTENKGSVEMSYWVKDNNRRNYSKPPVENLVGATPSDANNPEKVYNSTRAWVSSLLSI